MIVFINICFNMAMVYLTNKIVQDLLYTQREVTYWDFMNMAIEAFNIGQLFPKVSG